MSPLRPQMLAIVFGASRYPKAPKLASGLPFRGSAESMLEYLRDPNGLAIPDPNILDLFEDSRSPTDQLNDIAAHIDRRQLVLKAEGLEVTDLLLYYVGHGLFTRSGESYCLAVRQTDEDNEGASSIRATDLAETIKAKARFHRRILIVDCCFSAKLFAEFQSGPLRLAHERLRGDFPMRGTALFCSSNSRDASIAPQGEPHTMFSGALMEVLRQGDPSLGPNFSISELGDAVRERLHNRYAERSVRPEVLSPDQREGDVATFPLFPNPAYKELEEKKRAREKSAAARRREAEAARLAEENRLAEEQKRRAEEERQAAAAAAAEQERIRQEKEKAEAERKAAEKAAALRKEKAQAAKERAAKEKAEAESAAREKADRERAAKEKAKAEQIAAELKEVQRKQREQAARESAEQARQAREKAEAAEIARKQAEKISQPAGPISLFQTIQEPPKSKAGEYMFIGSLLVIAVVFLSIWARSCGQQQSDQTLPNADHTSVEPIQTDPINTDPLPAANEWTGGSAVQSVQLELVRTLKQQVPTERSFGLAFSPDGKLLATAWQQIEHNGAPPFNFKGNGTIRLWNVDTGELVRTLQPPGDDRPGDRYVSVAFSPDGRLLAASTDAIGPSFVHLFDVSNGTLLSTLPCRDSAHQVAFSSDGQMLGAACGDDNLYLWGTDSRFLFIKTLKQPAVVSLAFNPKNSDILAAGDYRQSIRVWSIQARRPSVLYAKPPSYGEAVAFSPDGQTLATGHASGAVVAWDSSSLSSSRTVRPSNGAVDGVTSVAFSPDGQILAASSEQQKLLLWDSTSWKPVGQFSIADGTTSTSYDGCGLAFNPRLQMLATTISGDNVQIWKVKIQR